jgi:hypothetical protein
VEVSIGDRNGMRASYADGGSILDTLGELLSVLQCPASYSDLDAGIGKDFCSGASAADVSMTLTF